MFYVEENLVETWAGDEFKSVRGGFAAAKIGAVALLPDFDRQRWIVPTPIYDPVNVLVQIN